MDIISYILAKKYTDKTVIGLGALKGANCTIDNIVHQNGVNIVTFRWVANDESVHTSQMIVKDGTPIYAWTSGDTYDYGDLAIYNADFYKCIVPNSDVIFNSSKWEAIGSVDGSFDIVEDSSLLPVSFTAADRKMYYSIANGYFWLWNGEEWVAQQPKTISKAEIDELFD